MTTTKFYTNIEHRGNHILYHGYENGLPVKKKVPYRPHLFVQDADGEYKAFTTKAPLKRQVFDSIKGMRDYVETYSDVSNFKIYGCSDIIRQYTANEFPGEISWDYEQTKIWFFDIETRVEGLDIDHDAMVDCQMGDHSKTLSYKQMMGLLDKDISFDVILDGKAYPIKQSPIYVAGFPEPKLAQQEILLISMIDHHSGKLHLWSNKTFDHDNQAFDLRIRDHVMKIKESMASTTPIKEYAISVRVFDMDEPAMLKDFLTFWHNQRIDVISGWNSEGFDVPYLVNRLKSVLGDELTSILSPWGIVKERNYKDDLGNDAQSYDIYGITHLDYLVLYKKFNPGAKESFKLDFIAELELGHGKLPLPGESFKENYLKHYDLFVLYNIIDTHLLHQLEKNLLQVRLAMQVAYMAKCNFGDVVSAMRVWESFIYNYFLDLKMIEDWKKPSNRKSSIIGAFVKEVVPGKYGWTISVDATSKYPSLMMQNNLSPETIVGKLDDIFIDDMLDGKHIGRFDRGTVVSANGLITRTDEVGFIPFLVKQMFDLRKKTKNRMLDMKREIEVLKLQSTANPDDQTLTRRIKELSSSVTSLDVSQQAFKVCANSLFGILNLPYFRYYNSDLAEAITSTGQVFIKHTQRIINEIMSKILGVSKEYVILSDTDSVYFDVDILVTKFCSGKSNSDIVNFMEKFVLDVIQPELNKQLAAIAKTMGIDNCLIYYKLECIGTSIIPLAKKKYLFDILYSEGVRYSEPKMKVMGIDIVRSSTPGAVKDYLTDAAKLCLRGSESELQKHVLSVKEKFMKLDYTQASFPRGCNGLTTYASQETSVSIDGSLTHGIYGKKTPIQVRGALVYNHHLKQLGLDKKYPLINDGERVKFIMLNKRNPFREDVIAFPTKLPTEFDFVRFVDWETQYQKAFIAPLQKLTDAMKWNITAQPSDDDLFG